MYLLRMEKTGFIVFFFPPLQYLPATLILYKTVEYTQLPLLYTSFTIDVLIKIFLKKSNGFYCGHNKAEKTFTGTQELFIVV